MYEMIEAYSLLDMGSAAKHGLTTVHLCEAPGAFIAATKHYLATKTTKENGVSTSHPTALCNICTIFNLANSSPQ